MQNKGSSPSWGERSLRPSVAAQGGAERPGVAAAGGPIDGAFAGSADGFRILLEDPSTAPRQLDNYFLSRSKKIFLSSLVEDLLERGFIKPSTSPWNSPVQLVPKGDGYRFTVNYRNTINPITFNDRYPLPNLREILQHQSQYSWFAKVDLSNGYWNLQTKDKATQDLMAFTCPGKGKFTWTVLAQGLKQAPSIFQREMDNLFDDTDWASPYLDDILIGGQSLAECRRREAEVFRRLKKRGFVVNYDKSIAPCTELPALGFLLRKGGFGPTVEYIDQLADTPAPEGKTDLRRFLGKLSFVTAHYPSLQNARSILFGTLNADRFRWKTPAMAAFSEIKRSLKTPLPLAHFDRKLPVTFASDAGDRGFSALAFQGPRLIGCISRRYPSVSFARASSFKRELLAMRAGIRAFAGFALDAPHSKYVTDNIALSTVLSRRNLGETSDDPFVVRALDDMAPYIGRLQMEWRPRTDALIRVADALGRIT